MKLVSVPQLIALSSDLSQTRSENGTVDLILLVSTLTYRYYRYIIANWYCCLSSPEQLPQLRRVTQSYYRYDIDIVT